MKYLTIKVPATTTNLGPGFDVTGIALNLYNEFLIKIKNAGDTRIDVKGYGENELPRNKTNLVYQALESGFKLCNADVPAMEITSVNLIPLNRGMGSSATAVAAGLLLAKEILGNQLSEEEIINLGVRLEGHPDNFISAYKGGANICFTCNDSMQFTPIHIPENLKAILTIPDIEINTAMARKILPENYPREDVVFNLQKIALFIHAMENNNLELLSSAMEDRVHEPFRRGLIPGYWEFSSRARKTGALGSAISGSGSTIITLYDGEKENAEQIVIQLVKLSQEVFHNLGIGCKIIDAEFTSQGATIYRI
ncbi:MAG: homoserine kinase [Vulcanimicrobiota bacterium]